MKVGIPATGPLGDRFEVWTIREPTDPLMSVTWSVCIKDSGGSVVHSEQIYHRVGIDPDTKIHPIDITDLERGIYRVDIYNWVNCNPPPGTDTYSVHIHRRTSRSVMFGMDGSWYPDRQYIFTVYVADGKLFYQSSSNRAVFIPANVDVFVEVTGSDGYAYVGVVNTSSDMRVMPNASIPFEAKLRFTLDRPKAWDVARAYANVIGFGRGVVVNVVDDYTFDLIIAKSELGLPPLVIGLAILGIIAVIVWGAALIIRFTVDLKLTNIMESMVNERNELVREYKAEYDVCTDDNCRRRVQEKYLPIIQGYDATIGALLSRLGTGVCNGVNIGGVCVPWWVMGVAIFLAGLLVISVVRR
ncbi:MAG: hypothetical protein ACO2PN_23530 [Pyrobaculum sp.]|jgi:hypothetical protein